jgi:hypothetical protein
VTVGDELRPYLSDRLLKPWRADILDQLDRLQQHEQGRLSAPDWDGATVAPPEHDLAVLLLFLLRRYVEDYTARVIRLHQHDTLGPDAQEALEGMRLWGSDQWARLEDTLDLVRDSLGRR